LSSQAVSRRIAGIAAILLALLALGGLLLRLFWLARRALHNDEALQLNGIQTATWKALVELPTNVTLAAPPLFNNPAEYAQAGVAAYVRRSIETHPLLAFYDSTTGRSHAGPGTDWSWLDAHFCRRFTLANRLGAQLERRRLNYNGWPSNATARLRLALVACAPEQRLLVSFNDSLRKTSPNCCRSHGWRSWTSASAPSRVPSAMAPPCRG
jgi:hypothetical protein